MLPPNPADPDLSDDADLAPASAAYQIRFRRYDRLAPHARNAQEHSAAQVAQIAASIEEFGFVGAVAADDRGILAGHGRTLAAERIYKAGRRIKAPNGVPIPDQTVPWIDCSGWSDAQRRAYIIVDNQLTRNAGVNQEFLHLELQTLEVMNFNLNLLGFDAAALDAILHLQAEAESSADEADEPEATASVIHCPSCGHDFSVLEEMKARRRRRAV